MFYLASTKLRLLLFVGALLLLASTAFAQTASLSGSVKDASQSPVANATVTLSEPSTGFSRTTQTNETGLFTFTYLQPGVYNLQAASPGLAPQTREGIRLEVAQTVRVDFELQVGSTQQKIEVSASADLIQPDTSSLGQVINERSVNELPLNGRNPLALVALVPGVIPQGQSQQNAAGTNNSAYGNFQIGGGVANQSAFVFDGISLVVPFGHAVELIPSQELVQEFKVQTNNLAPEFGEFSGGVVNLTSKAGTNSLHGEGYEFLRNKVLNSNNFFNNRSGVPTGAFTQNQFGATLGGPVVIPHVYDGHDKSFFFLNYEGFRLRQGQPLLLSVPTQAERNGDFRGLVDSNGNPLNIYNPFSSTTTAPRQQVQCNGVLNVICPSQIDPVAAKLVSLWGLPNIPGAQNSPVNNWAGNASSGGNTDQGTFRFDHYVSQKQRLFLRYTYWKDLDLAVDPFGNGTYAGGIGTPEWYSTHHIVLDDTYTFSPTTIADFRVGVMRFSYMRSPETAGIDLTTIGWPSFMNEQIPSAVRTLPNICVAEFNEFCGGNTGSVLDSWDTNYEADPSVTTVQGKHTLKFGMQFRVSRQNYIQTNNGTGGYNFDQGYTSAVPLQSGGGNGFASFLFGAVQNASVQEPAATASQLIYQAYYLGDTYKVTDRLTLDLGLRYEITGPWTERYNRVSYWDANAVNPLSQSLGFNPYGAVGLVATPTHPDRSAVSTNYHELSPRIGLAYQLTPKTVIRTGYGIVWLPIDVNLNSAPDHDVINAIYDAMVTSTNGNISPHDVLSNPFPNGITPPPQRSPGYQQALYGQNILTQSPDNLLGYTQQWNFDVQRQLTGNALVDVAYAGAKGTHLPLQNYDVNYLTIPQLSLGSTLTNTVPNPFYGKVPSTSPLGATSTIAEGKLLLPYPAYGNVQFANQGMGDSSYNSLQAKFESRFGSGGTLLAAYTFSKLISNAESLTPWLESNWNAGFQYWGNLRAERSLATFDVPQRAVVSYVLDLPVGRGRKYLSNVHGVTSALVSGWGIDGILTLQRGTPLFLGTAQNLTGNYDGGSRPNFNKAACPNGPGVSGSRESRLNEWFNPNCFTQPAPFTYGNLGRTLNLRADGIRNLDFALFKKTSFGPEGRIDWEFRAEAFNLLNTPQFGYPNMTTGLPGQTGVISSQANNPRLIQLGTKLRF